MHLRLLLCWRNAISTANYFYRFTLYGKAILNDRHFPVGAPLHVEQKLSPSEEEINELHDRYCTALKRLFDEYKLSCDDETTAETQLKIVWNLTSPGSKTNPVLLLIGHVTVTTSSIASFKWINKSHSNLISASTYNYLSE